MVNITEPKMSAYLHSKAKENGTPLAGNFELSSNCNFNCPMCYVSQNEPCEDALSAEDWIEITDTACDNGMLFLLLTGGEPFLKKDFDKIYTHAHEKGLIISINSNGSLADRYIDLLKKYPPVRINISLYASSAAGYKKQCMNACFEKVMENIKALQKINIPLKLNTVITKLNCDDIENIIALSKSLGVPIQITPYCYPPIRLDGVFGKSDSRLSSADAGFYSVRGDIALYGSEEFIKKASQAKSSESYSGGDCSLMCRAGSSSFWITCDGKMRACAMMDKPSADLKDMDFCGAWEYIRKQTSLLRTPAECRDCPDSAFCRACAAMCLCETGFTDKKPEYVCEMIRSIRKNTENFLKKTEKSL